MKTLIGLLLMLAMPLTIGCGSNSGGDSRLQRTWKYKQIVNAGKETPAELLNRAPTVTFEGNKMITKDGDKVVETWTYKVDTSQDPKRMTITMGEPGKERDHNEFYKIEGDTLTMCYANKIFSNAFNTKLEPDAYFSVRTRVKE